mmetsp:Transcript_23311/g.59879  ORF Transcript_23311/g.59879 Transcript_23311/m.59879 type:complete len:214 (-) Transcript_23311:36-677(-)
MDPPFIFKLSRMIACRSSSKSGVTTAVSPLGKKISCPGIPTTKSFVFFGGISTRNLLPFCVTSAFIRPTPQFILRMAYRTPNGIPTISAKASMSPSRRAMTNCPEKSTGKSPTGTEVAPALPTRAFADGPGRVNHNPADTPAKRYATRDCDAARATKLKRVRAARYRLETASGPCSATIGLISGALDSQRGSFTLEVQQDMAGPEETLHPDTE